MINLFFLSSNTTGGWVTFTAHLSYGLRNFGGYNLYKIGNRSEENSRSFGYSVNYRNVSLVEALNIVDKGSSLIVALQKKYIEQSNQLLKHGAWIVVHDPTEFNNADLNCYGNRCLVIRNAVLQQIPGSKFLPHPYKRYWPLGTVATGKSGVACSISRIDRDKKTYHILDANRILPDHLKIHINGFDSRVYSKFWLMPRYPEYKQSIYTYSRERHTATGICHNHLYAVDMSIIRKDGGGTQYTFLEAMDAGCVNIINKGWIIPEDEMVPYPHPASNCFAAENGQQIANIIANQNRKDLLPIIARGEELLARHSATKVAAKLEKIMGV